MATFTIIKRVKYFDIWVAVIVCLMGRLIVGKVIKVVDDIEKQATDKRLYRGLELSNGLKAVVISDPNTTSAAAALRVAIGAMSDPWEAQGVAHFTEHLLFMGTEKYPDENDYTKFVTSHGGKSNAMTSLTDTVYYFNIDHEYLDGMLDRFSQFFITPLFSASAVEREVNAINSEYSTKFDDKIRKLEQLQKTLSKPGHDFGKFTVGSKETLFDIPQSKGINPRDLPVQFYDKWYSANLMTLAIVGKESLDELTELVDAKFSNIRNKNVTEPTWDYPFETSTINNLISIKTNIVGNEMVIAYPITNLDPGYTEEIIRYMSYRLDDQGEGSLSAHLSSLGWARGSNALTRQVLTGFGVTEITLSLTQEGRKHIYEIIEIVTQYINLLSSAGVQKTTYKESDFIRRNQFVYKQKENPIDLVQTLTASMKKYNFEQVLKGDYVMKEYNPKAIEDVLMTFTPKNMGVFLISNKFSQELDRIEKWYNTSYSIEKFKPAFLKKLSNVGLNPNLKLPGPNEFANVQTRLKPRDPKMTDVPELIGHDSMMDVWYHQDQTFLIPKAKVSVRLTNPNASVDPLHNYVIRFFTAEINRLFQLNLYSASKAGLKCAVSGFNQGLDIEVDGNTENLDLLLMKILDIIIDFHGDPHRFQIVKKQGIELLENINRHKPVEVATFHFLVLLTCPSWTFDQKWQALSGMEFCDFDRIFPKLLQYLHIDVFGSGNVNRQQISNIASKVKSKLISQTASKPYPLKSMETKSAVQLYEGENKVFIADHKTEKDSAVIMFMQANQSSVLNTILAQLLAQMASAPLFDDLRTKQQLGYSVSSFAVKLYGLMGFQVIVQSPKQPHYVDSRIENSLFQLKRLLNDMTDRDFEAQKQGFESNMLNTIPQLSTQTSLWWQEITETNYNFHKRDMKRSTLRNITKQQLLNFYDAYVNPQSKTRSRLHIWIVGTEARDAGFRAEDICKNSSMPTCIDDEIEFKNQHPLYPNQKPFTTVEELLSRPNLFTAGT